MRGARGWPTKSSARATTSRTATSRSTCVAAEGRSGQLLVPRPPVHARLGAGAAAEVFLVLAVVAFVPHHLAGVLEREDVAGDAVEEPAVVRDHQRAAREGEQ